MENSHINKEYYKFDDFRQLAKQNLDKINYDYYEGGANDHVTLTRNTMMLNKVLLNPRVLKNVQTVNTKVKVLGQEVSMPIGISPTAFNQLAHPEGERNNSRAATKNKIIYCLSSISTTFLEGIAKISDQNSINWYQFYVKDLELTEKIIKRLEKNNFKAVVITVDRPKLGKRLSDVRNGFKVPDDFKIEFFDTKVTQTGEMKYRGEEMSATLNWDDIVQIKSMTQLPIVLKGIYAKKAASIGVHIWVSNHGGRQLDTVRGTIELLQECVQAVKDIGNKNIEIFVDGGVRKGADVAKFLALGANCVFTGRGIVYGNSVEGQRGIEKYIQMIRDEFVQTMQFLGKTDVKQIGLDTIIKSTLPIPNL